MVKKELKYIKCPTFIFSLNMNDNGKGDGTDKLMLFMLMSLGDDSKNYNQEQLGRMIGCSTMTAGKCLHRLEENGYITVTKGKFDPKAGCKTKNTFKVNMDYITSLASDKDYFISKEVETPKEKPVEIDTPPAEEIKEPEIIPTIQEEEMVFATTTVEDVINNPELSFLLDENEITLEDEVAIAASRLSNINDVAQYYKEMNSTVTKLHIKYNVSKKYVDEMINNKINKAA